jgi:hypothetical protein
MIQLNLFTADYQQRFQAYLNYMNADSHEEIKMYEFIVWVSGHAEAFKRKYNTNTLHGRQSEFTEYLWEQVEEL